MGVSWLIRPHLLDIWLNLLPVTFLQSNFEIIALASVRVPPLVFICFHLQIFDEDQRITKEVSTICLAYLQSGPYSNVCAIEIEKEAYVEYDIHHPKEKTDVFDMKLQKTTCSDP